MKTKIYSILSLLFLVYSCELKEDYNQDTDVKIQAIADEYQKILCEAPYGWNAILDTKAAGGFLLWMNFSKDYSVEMVSDFFERQVENADSCYTSTYRFRALQRPTLSFDTYSPLHFMSDPDRTVNGAPKNGTGLLADFEFEVVKYENNEFILEGRTNGCTAFLRKATAEEATAAKMGILMENAKYAATYAKTKKIQFTKFNIGDNAIGILMHNRLGEITYIKEGAQPGEKGAVVGDYLDVWVDYNKNLQMVVPRDINGKKLTQLTYNATTDSYDKAIVDGEEYTLSGSIVPVTPIQYVLGDKERYNYKYTSVQIVQAEGFKPYEGTTDDFKAIYTTLVNQFKTLNTTTTVPGAIGKKHFLRTIDLHFTSNSDGSPAVELFIDTKIGAYGCDNIFLYQLHYNDDHSFTLRNPVFSHTSTDKEKSLYVQPDIFRELTEFFSNHTFKIEWAETTALGYWGFRMVNINLTDQPETLLEGEILDMIGNL